jgi:hypothetical protein
MSAARMRRSILVALAGVIAVSHPAHADDLFKCGVDSRDATVVVVPKNLKPGEKPPEFTRNSVPIPPLLWLSSDRHFAEVLMLYWRVDDVESKSRFRLLVPFILDDCRPEARTTLTPLFGWKKDRDGTAGYILNYYFRRDAQRDANVLFPFYWRTRLFRSDGTVESSSLGIPPLALRLESPDATTWITLLGYVRSGQAGWDAGLWPLWFGGGDKDGSYAIIPPLLTAWWSEGQDHTLIAGPLFDRRVGGKHVGGLVPLVFYERAPGENFTLIPPLLTLLTDETTIVGPYYSHGGHRGVVPFFFEGPDYLVIPPLLTLHTPETTIIGPYYSHGRHRGVMPFFFEGPDYLVIGPYYSYDGYSGVVPFYFRGPDHLLIPPLLTFQYREGQTETTIVGPSFLRTEPSGWDAGLAPLVFAGHHGASHYLLVPPALTFHTGDADSELTLSPVWMRGRFPHSSFMAIPPLLTLHAEDGNRAITFAGPLWWQGHEGREHFWAVPAALAFHVGDDQTETTIVGPGYLRRQADGWDSGVAPLFFAAHHGDSHYALIPPALTLHYGEAGTETTVVGPAYLRTHTQGWDAGLAPIVFAAHHVGSQYAIVAPLFFEAQEGARHFVLIPPLLVGHAGDAEHEFTLAGPFYSWRGPDSEHDGVLPLWIHGRWNDGVHYLAIPPALTLHLGDGKTETTVVGPGYLHTHPEGWDAGVAPLVFAAHHADSHYLVIPPALTVHYAEGATETTVVGPGYLRTHPDGWDAGLAPAVFAAHHPDSHYLLIPPALTFHYGEGATETTIVGPGYLHTHPEGWDTGVAPLFFAAHHGASHYTLVPPLVFLHTGDDDGELTIAGPLFAQGTRSNGEHFLAIPAALTLHTGDGESETTVVGPGYLRTHADGGWDTGVAPLFFAAHHDDTHYLVIPPALTLHYGEGATETTIVGPGYLHTHPDGWDAGVAPLLFAARHGASHYTLIPALATLHEGDADSELTIAGPFYAWQTTEFEHDGVLPLWLHGQWRDGTHYLLIPPALTVHEGGADSETTVVGPGYLRTHADGGWDTGVAPLFFAAHHGDSHALVVPPALTLHIGDADSETTVVGPGYLHTHPAGWDAGLAPAAFIGRHGESAYTLVAPPLFMRWSDADSATTIAGPVYVSSSPHSTSVAVAPLAYYHGEGDSTSLTIFPLMHYSATQRSHTVLAPLFYHDADPGSAHTMVFPFYWNSYSETGSSRVAFPFYWDFESKEHDWRFTLAPPVYLHYRKGETETNIVGPVAWSWGRTAKGPSWSFHLFPAFSMESARPDHFKWRLLYGLAGHESAGDWHRWQVLYMWTDPSRT